MDTKTEQYIDDLGARLEDRERQLATVRQWMALHGEGPGRPWVRELSRVLLWSDAKPERPDPPNADDPYWTDTSGHSTDCKCVDCINPDFHKPPADLLGRVDELEGRDSACTQLHATAATRITAMEQELVKLGDLVKRMIDVLHCSGPLRGFKP